MRSAARRGFRARAKRERSTRGIHAGPSRHWQPAQAGTTIHLLNEKLHLTILYSDAGDGWVTAQVAEIPGAISEGETREEARSNVLDALDVLLTPDEELAGTSSSADSESLTLTVTS